MKGIVLLSVLLIAVAAHAEDQPKNTLALTNQVREVERQLVRSGLPENDAQGQYEPWFGRSLPRNR